MINRFELNDEMLVLFDESTSGISSIVLQPAEDDSDIVDIKMRETDDQQDSNQN